MFVIAYVGLCVRVRACVRACVRVCVHPCLLACACMCVHACVCVRIHACVYVFVCMHEIVCVNMHACNYECTDAGTHKTEHNGGHNLHEGLSTTSHQCTLSSQ